MASYPPRAAAETNPLRRFPAGLLVDRACEIIGAIPPSLETLSRHQSDGPLSLTALKELAQDRGLHAEAFTAPTGAALKGLDRERPIATLSHDNEALLLVERKGRRVCVEDGNGRRSWLDAPQLAERLGLAHFTDEHRWLSLHSGEEFSVPLKAAGSPWGNAITLLRSEGANLGAITLYAVGVGLLSLVLPLAVQTLVNTVAFGQLLQPILVLTLLLAGGLVFAAGLQIAQAWVVEVVQRRIFVKLVSELAERLPKVHVTAFEKGNGPELINRFFDVFLAQKAVAALLLGGVEAVLTALVGLVVLAFYHPALLGFGLMLILCAGIVFSLLGRGATKTTIAESKAKYAVAGWLEEMIRHPFFLKLAGGGDYARGRLDELAVEWLQRRSAHFRIFYRQLIGALALQVVAHASLLGLGGWLVVERALTIGQLVAAELIVTAVVASLSKLGGKLESVYDLIAAADKLGALLGLPLEDRSGDDTFGGAEAARLELRSVTSPDNEVTDFSLHLEPGEIAAIRGNRRMSSSLVDLLFGMRMPSGGVVLIDGQDLRDIRLDSLRTRVAVVREPEVLPGTISSNIRAARNHVPTSEVWNVLAEVGLADAIRAMPRGLQTELTPSGAPLDRLDALRLTLARALAARPSLLVLDGVIDALPEEERGPIIQSVNQNRTVVILTHERSVADYCGTCLELPQQNRNSRLPEAGVQGTY